ncbi:MAG: SURF1 family protein [Pseudomonadota bacterium]
MPKKRFAPGLWSTLAVLVLAPLFAGLSYWQLQRAEIKETLLAQRDNAKDVAPVSVTGSENITGLHLQNVLLECVLQIDKQFLLDNRVFEQRVGYEVLLPCTVSKDESVLLNRGWIAAGTSREDLPDVTLQAQASKSMRIEGVFVVPGRAVAQGELFDPGEQVWPRRIQFYDYAELGRVLSQNLMRGIVILEKESPLVLEYNWQPIAFGPEKHYAYAAQWAAFLLLLLILYAALNVKNVETEEHS